MNVKFGGCYYIPERYLQTLSNKRRTVLSGISPVYSKTEKYGATVDVPDQFDQQFETNLKAEGIDEFIRRDESRGELMS